MQSDVKKETSIETILQAIDHVLRTKEDRFESIGVKYGITGLCLYRFARAIYFDSEHELAEAFQLLQRSFEKLNDDYRSPHIFFEMAELGWAIELLKNAGLYDADTNDVLADFDELLLRHLNDCIADENFDMAIGALAFGNYYRARSRSNKSLESLVGEVCSAFAEGCVVTPQGVYWTSKIMNDDSIYTGVSHGLAGINLFLLRAARGDANYANLVRESFRFLLHLEMDKDSPVYFPVVANKPNGSSLYANNWCYGDPATLYSLLTCASYLQDEDLKIYALEKLKECAFRERNETYLIAGFSLLYGYAGLVMLYSKMYEMTREPFLLDATQKLKNKIISAFDPDDPFLGYAGYWNQQAPLTNYSLAEGMIGIALLLMSEKRPQIKKLYEPFYSVGE